MVFSTREGTDEEILSIENCEVGGGSSGNKEKGIGSGGNRNEEKKVSCKLMQGDGVSGV